MFLVPFRNVRGGISVAGRKANVITATVAPSLAALTAAQTPADGLNVEATQTGNYASDEGTIVSAVAAVSVNGGAYVETTAYDIQPGDLVQVRVVVSDDAGNSRSFYTQSQGIAPAFTAQPTATPSPAFVGQTVVLDGGAAGQATLTIEYLTLDGVDDTENLEAA